LRDLRAAWDQCFKRKAGAPRFKKKGQSDSFELDGTIKILGANHIQVPKFGVLKTFESLPQVQPKNVTISRHADRWFISFKIEVSPTTTEKANRSVGVDLGIKKLAFLSNGESFDVPDEYRRLKAKIARLQYIHRHKVKGSANWKQAQKRIATLYYRASCIRKDVLHKLTTYLATTFEVICIEDLNVSGMMANHKLAGAIGDIGWYEFRRQLEYKSKLYGSQLRVIGRFEPSSQVHHKCGWKNEQLTLRDRTFFCPQCNQSIDRDLNAALNIERFGLSLSS